MGTVGEVRDTEVRIDFFASVAVPVAKSTFVQSRDCKPVALGPATRVYWRNPDTGRWLPGRVASAVDGKYYITFPNHRYDFPIPSAQLRVRWDGDHTDPAAVLGVGAHESGYFRNTRLPFLQGLITERGASANIAGFLSSAVEIYPHQVYAALTVLSDPVQRYLLADEVGLGKTVEAGFVIRQTLIDNPRARIVLLTPDNLRRQWREELIEKFFTDDFPWASIKIRPHDDPSTWADHHGWDLLVVDEAHRLTQVEDPSESSYPQLRALAHSIEKVLLLSATPTTSYFKTHLGLLHLLDPKIYSWADADQFAERYRRRLALADSIYALDSQFTVYLESSVAEIRTLLGVHDPQFELLSSQVLELIDEDFELRPGISDETLKTRVEELRAHVSETYRLHRRVIRNRRANVLDEELEDEFPGYDVRGRQVPTVLNLDAEAHDTAENAVLDWHARVGDHLDQVGPNTDAQLYGAVLKILVSRSGIVVDDLLDTLRWRMNADGPAAERAHLSTEERRALHAAPIVASERELLAELERLDTAKLRKSALERLSEALSSVLLKYRRTVVFCGPGQLGELLADHLRATASKVGVGEHTHGAGPENAHNAVRAWAAPFNPRGERVRLLVVDDSGEDGLNLQLAEAALHLRMPWSPNQLEQRLGRIDRYRSVDAVSHSRPADQYRLTSAQGDVTFTDAWTDLLVEGYELFHDSVSTLQDAIADSISGVWSQGMRQGPAGVHGQTQVIRSALDEAREEIEKMDMLEAIHHSAVQDTGIASKLIRFETEWRAFEAALSGFTSETDGGIGLRHRPGNGTEVFDLRNSKPLVDPRLWHRTVHRVGSANVEGVFNRSVALKKPGTRIFRSGNPLTDALAEWAWHDDRGQATAFSRPYKYQTIGADPYFGFDYLVEADIAPAAALVTEHTDAEKALRRQADRVLTPFSVRVWIDATTGEPVVDEAQRRWLDMPYDKNARKDKNYSGARLRDLFEIFGGPDEYQEATTAAEAASRKHMTVVTDLRKLCDEAQAAAKQRMAVSRAQAQARKAAGHLVSDVDSYLLDTDIAEALVNGLSNPVTRLIAAVCLVRVPGAPRVR
ncbi:ATP-dependent helicase HepA [Saccharothrix variisporea]|uniref:ATP-dependent helicase HepA n=1 Tax=Saccharothrix variisporea TaxID=543527 RepID=A0A495XMA2_9PSEU|nr:ATP-dependent helicase HepA [Saccharothrix variisporea]